MAVAADKPNVLLIITDDQGYGDLGAHGNTMIRTPHLDRLHRESVRFTDFHVDPTCSPTRAALLTGRYSTRAGVWHTIMGRSILFRDELTLSEVLAANGYRTGIFGKWHLGDNYPARPQDRGFHEVLIHGGGGIGQTPDFWGNDYQVTLRHRPAAAAFPLQATTARVKVGSIEAAAAIPPGSTAVTLTLELPAGPSRVETALTDATTGKTRGAFFVAFERLDR